jgi:enoyl-CoA hydratase/carnithine racemase
MTYSQIRYGVHNRVAVITLDRPDRLNAWTPTMQIELEHALTAAGEDKGVRVIVVTGADRAFCAGMDLDVLKDAFASGVSMKDFLPRIAEDDSPGADFDQPLSYVARIPKPVIAAINGPAAGVGLAFSLFCDIRFVAEGAKLTTAFAGRGLIAEFGTAWMLPRLVGQLNAIDLLFTSRTIDADEAARMGLALALPAEGFVDRVLAYAERMADTVSPRSLAVIKRQVWQGLMQTLAQASVLADREALASLQSADFKEGVAHFLEKRPPNFTGV